MNQKPSSLLRGLAIFLLGAVAGVMVLPQWRDHRKEESVEEPGHDESGAREHASEGSPPPGVVKLDAETRGRFGVVTSMVEEVSSNDEISAPGHVVDATALVQAVADVDAAAAALNAAEKEVERVQKLSKVPGAVSAHDFDTAEAERRRDEVTLLAAKLKLRTTWGAALAERADLQELLNAFASGQSALVRLDLVAGADTTPVGIRVGLLGDAQQCKPVTASWFAPAPIAGAATQSHSWFALVKGAGWPSGAAVQGWLGTAAAPRKGVLIPATAVLRHAGRPFVYRERPEEEFEQVVVQLEWLTDRGWFATGSVKAGDRIVTAAAGSVWAADLAMHGGAADEE